MTGANARRAGVTVAACILAAMLLNPFLLVLYRLCVFSTVPYDDYAPYLLWVADRGGYVPAAPYCYRILSMVAALPFFELLPPPHVTNLPTTISPDWVRATFALNALGFCSMVAASVAAGAIAIARSGMDLRDAVLVGALLFALAWYTQITAIDGLALLLITLAVHLVRRPLAFAALLLVSVGCNEKVALIAALWCCARCVASRGEQREWLLRAGIAIGAVGAYLVTVAVLHRPGHAYQTHPSQFTDTVVMNLRAYVSPRGFALNALPIAVLCAIAAFGHLARERRRGGGLFAPADMLVIPGLMLVALVFTELFQAGRLVMHAAPLFVIPAVAAIPGRQDRATP